MSKLSLQCVMKLIVIMTQNNYFNLMFHSDNVIIVILKMRKSGTFSHL